MFWLGLALGWLLGVWSLALFLRLLSVDVAGWWNAGVHPAPRGGHYDVPPPKSYAPVYPILPSYIGTTPEDAEFARIVDSERRSYWQGKPSGDDAA